LSIFFLFLSIIFDLSIINQFERIIQFTLSDIHDKSGNTQYRIEELNFFLNKLDLKSFFLGYGIDNQKVVQLYNNNNINYYLSDLGIFRTFYYHGLIGLSIFIKCMYDLYKESKIGLTIFHRFGRGFVLFQLLSLTTQTFFYNTDIMMIFLTLFACLKIINNRIGVRYQPASMST